MKTVLLANLTFSSLLVLGTARASSCFPPDIQRDGVYEGKRFTFVVKDIHQCWVKAVICTSKEKCRETPYWIHSSTIEAYRAKETS